jgi:hypothetical protein
MLAEEGNEAMRRRDISADGVDGSAAVVFEVSAPARGKRTRGMFG